MSSFLSLAQESVKQQSDRLYKSLIRTLTDAKELPIGRVKGSGVLEELQALIKTEVNVNIDFSLAEKDNREDELEIFFFDPRVFKQKKKIESDLVELAKLTFDLRNAKIIGNTERIPATCSIPRRFLTDERYKPEWIAGAILHEVGHVYVELMMLGSVERSNQALSRVAKDFDNNENVTTRTTRFIQVFDKTNLSKDQIKKVASADRFDTVLTTAFEETMENLVHLLGSKEYDSTISENLADEFAVRFGAGKALAEFNAFNYSTITKLEQKFTRRVHYLTGVWWVVLGVLTVFTLSVVAFAVLHLILSLVVSYTFKPSSWINYSYDRDKDRVIRIRNQMQLRMRQTVRNSEDYEKLKAELDAVDAIVKSIDQNKDNVSYFSQIRSFIYNPVRRFRSQGEKEMLVESIAYNPLHDQTLNFKYGR